MPPQVHARKGTISKVDERVQWGEYMGDNTQITRRVRKYVCIDKVRKKQTEIKGAEPSRRLGLQTYIRKTQLCLGLLRAPFYFLDTLEAYLKCFTSAKRGSKCVKKVKRGPKSRCDFLMYGGLGRGGKSLRKTPVSSTKRANARPPSSVPRM